MNPFDLDAARFFYAYVVVLVAVVWGVRWLRRTQEQGVPPTPTDMDPYSVAVLRGGVASAAQLAFAHVSERGWVRHEGFNVTAVPESSSPHVVEQTLLQALRTSRRISDVFRLPELMTLLEGYQRQLQVQGLLPDATRVEQRQALWRGGVGVLWLIVGIRIATQLSRGEPAPWDVVTLAMVAVPFVRMAAMTRRTWKGDQVWSELVRRVRQRLPSLSQSQGWGPEHLLAGAVLGLSGAALAHRMRITNADGSVSYRRAHDGSDSSSFSSTSSSSTSSSSTSSSTDTDDTAAGDSGESSGGGESSCGGDGGGD